MRVWERTGIPERVTPHNAHGALYRKQLVRQNVVQKRVLKPLQEAALVDSKELKI
jgi:hypothetical protein